MHTPHDDLARARQAFELWRAKRQSRSRIPPELWDKAVSLLAHHPITHVARALRLDPAELRKRRHASSPLPVPDNSAALRFVELPSADLNTGNRTHPQNRPAPRQVTETAIRLLIEHANGHHLTLHLPASEWSRLEALYSLFLRS